MNPVRHQRTKHIDTLYYAIRSWILNRSIKLQYCSMDKMITDGLTKPLGGPAFKSPESICSPYLVTISTNNI